jgi:hypothetical protein
MNDFNQEYYFVSKPSGRNEIPYLTPNEETTVRDYRFARQDPFSPPLVFFNRGKEYKARQGIQSVRVPPQILFNGSNMLVPTDIRDQLLELEIPNLAMHPSVYIHDDGSWYEGYWYVAFTERFDCWDRKKSVYNDKLGIECGDSMLYEVHSFSLDEEILAKTPLKDRLLFQMGGITSAPLVCHKSLYPLLHGAEGKGAQLALITDF